jgi:hypothetical protein
VRISPSIAVADHGPAIEAQSNQYFWIAGYRPELSIPSGGGQLRGVLPRSNVSMMIMRPPHLGQGHARIAGSLFGSSVGSAVSRSGCGFAIPSNSRAFAMFFARPPLANKP